MPSREIQRRGAAQAAYIGDLLAAYHIEASAPAAQLHIRFAADFLPPWISFPRLGNQRRDQICKEICGVQEFKLLRLQEVATGSSSQLNRGTAVLMPRSG